MTPRLSREHQAEALQEMARTRDAASEAGLRPAELRRRQRVHRAALSRVVAANAGLLHVMLRRWLRRPRIDPDDLFQIGRLGLLRALRDFDPGRGFTLSTYAHGWVDHYVRRALDEGDLVRKPAHAAASHRQIQRARALFLTDMGREPTGAELARSTGLPLATVERDRSIAWTLPSSVDVPAGDGPASFVDLVVDGDVERADDALERHERTRFARDLLDGLPTRERGVLAARFGLDGGDGLTLGEIGVPLGVCRERVRQIEASALDMLRARVANGGPRAFE
jgi:RNA polymerase sigma factor (sigma-70 family)